MELLLTETKKIQKIPIKEISLRLNANQSLHLIKSALKCLDVKYHEEQKNLFEDAKKSSLMAEKFLLKAQTLHNDDAVKLRLFELYYDMGFYELANCIKEQISDPSLLKIVKSKVESIKCKLNNPEEYLIESLHTSKNYFEHWAAYSNLGMAYRNYGILFNSLDSYRKAFTLNPNSKLVNLGLGITILRIIDTETNNPKCLIKKKLPDFIKEADSCFLKLKCQINIDSKLNFYLGLVENYKGNTAQALKYFNIAEQLNSQDIEPIIGAFNIYIQSGKQEKAQECLDSIKRISNNTHSKLPINVIELCYIQALETFEHCFSKVKST